MLNFSTGYPSTRVQDEARLNASNHGEESLSTFERAIMRTRVGELRILEASQDALDAEFDIWQDEHRADLNARAEEQRQLEEQGRLEEQRLEEQQRLRDAQIRQGEESEKDTDADSVRGTHESSA